MNAISKPPVPASTLAAQPIPNDPELLTAYFRQVASYQANEVKRARRSVRVAWTVAVAAGVVAGTACMAVAGLAPLKTVEPIVFRVNDTTGMVDRVFDVRGGEMAASEAERRYFLWQYILHRQGYQFTDAVRDFDVVNLMSTADVQQQYAAWFKGSNPQSPQVLLGRNGSATVNWVSTSFLGPKQAQVRFTQQERKGDTLLALRHMVATITFDFARGDTTGSAINVNPDGFLVTSYRVDQENAQ